MTVKDFRLDYHLVYPQNSLKKLRVVAVVLLHTYIWKSSLFCLFVLTLSYIDFHPGIKHVTVASIDSYRLDYVTTIDDEFKYANYVGMNLYNNMEIV